MSWQESARKLLARVLDRLGVPGSQYLIGDYVFWRRSTVFPRANIGLLDIAEDVELHGALLNAQDRITIEPGAVLGHQVAFLTGRHVMGPSGVRVETSARGPIVVERRAWIASRAIILGGVTIGEGSMIGAGAVVTRSVPAGEFWAGSPAEFVSSTNDQRCSRP